jgi:hypothetical protein
VDDGDRRFWVNELKHTYFGDANLDEAFNSTDLIDAFKTGEYEDRGRGNSSWADGDWDGDGEFTSSDFITAFQSGGYELAARFRSLKVTVEPSENGKVVYLPLAAKTTNDVQNAQLAMKLFIQNNENHSVTVTGVNVTTSQTSSNISINLEIPANSAKSWFFPKEAIIILPNPAPTSVQISLDCTGCQTTNYLTLPLSPHASPVAGGSYRFPAKASDLRQGEYWSGASASHAPAGDGGQLFAYDMGVVDWDPDTQSWTSLLPGTDGSKNEHYRIWGKPIYAMADGTVVQFDNEKPNNPKPGEDLSPPDPVEGNHFYIQHGDELMLYAHFIKGSLNASLMTVGATVKAGQFLGLAGNSGNSTAPHLHIHAIQGTQPWQGTTRPIPFHDIHVIDRDALASGGPDGAWVKVDGRGLPNDTSVIWPASSDPCLYPPGWSEIAKHGVANANYQAVFTSVAECGYRPEWVDGFDVSGNTYFNVVFRPSDGTPWVARHNLTASEYQAEFNKWVGEQKYRLSHIDSYLVGGAPRYAAIFDKPQTYPLFTAYHGQSVAQHQQSFNDLTQQGWVPVKISVVSVNGTERYTALYEKKNVGSFIAKSRLTAAQYQAEFDANVRAGRELVYVNGYVHQGTTYFSAIWHQMGMTPLVARHHLTSAEYQDEFDTQLKNGYLTRAVTGYAVGASIRYAALWTK